MTPEERRITKIAKDWSKDKANVQHVLRQLVGGEDYSTLQRPAAVFMAGSPGAGKTEVAKDVLGAFDPKPVRVDADDFRTMMPGYDGKNAHLFQEAATSMVQKVLDRIYDSGKSGSPVPFILDGTFTYARTMDNLKRALNHGYAIDIFYVYQRPELAWSFTKARELREGRIVPKDVFVRTFLQARANVIEAKKIFGERVKLSVIIKNTDATDLETHAYIAAADLERIIPRKYNEDELRLALENDN